MKICELKIQNGPDRERLVIAPVNAGYRVSVEIRKCGQYDFDGVDFYVLVEGTPLPDNQQIQ